MLAMQSPGDERLSSRGKTITLPRLMLASSSEMKRNATLKALQMEGVEVQKFLVWGGDGANDHKPGYTTESNEARARARVQLPLLRPAVRSTADLFLGIHVGASPLTETHSQWSLAVGVYLCDGGSNGVSTASAALPLPLAAVEAVNPATATSDLRSLVSSWTNGKETDPFSYFTFGRRREEEYIVEAVRHALYPFMFPERHRKPWR